MSLRTKTLLSLVTALTTALAVVIFLSKFIILRSFNELEMRNMKSNFKRVANTLHREINYLNAITYDWSAWDDTYKFVKDSNSAYIKSNLVDLTFQNLKVNLIIIANRKGDLIYSKCYDLDTNKEIVLNEFSSGKLDSNYFLFLHHNENSSIVGHMIYSGKPFLLASRPIIQSNEVGPIRGTLIMGRYLNEAKIRDIENSVQIPLSLEHFNNPNLSPDFVTAKANFDARNKEFIRIKSSTELQGYLRLNDIKGDPSLIFRLEAKRDIYQRGLASIRLTTFFIISIGSVLGIVILLLIEQFVVSRISSLGSQVTEVGKEGSSLKRVTLSGKDEIAKLAGNINRMLDNLDRADEAIRLDEERYRAFVSQSAEAIWCFDFRQPVPTHLPAEEQIDWAYNNGYLTECNDAMARMYGFQSSDQILGAKIGDILPKEDPKNLQFLYAILENDYSIANIETHDIDKDGNFFYTLNNLTGIIEDGKLVRIWGTQRDITNLKKNEENLRFLAHTISSVNDAVTITDLEGKLIFVNDAFCKTYGYTPQEVIGKGVDFLRAENQVPKEEIRQTTIEGGWSGELLNRRANGEIFPIYLSTSKVINEKGEIIGLVGISRDITEEKITLEALITSEMRYRNLFENATDAIFLLRGDKILDCNKSAERMFRCTHKELLDQHPLTFSPPIQPDGSDSNEKSLEKYKSALEGNPQNFEWMHRRFDGGSFYTEVNLSRIQLGGEWILLSIIRDFSERRRMEEALKASEEFNRGIIVNAPVGIIYLDATGIIAYENPEMMKMMGMPEGVPSAVTGKNILHIPNIVKAGGDSMIRRLLKGELIKGETIEYESLYGVKKTLEIHASPLKDSEGNIFGAVLMCVDITSYKQLEAQLRHSQKIEAIGTLAEGIAHDFNNLLTGIIGNTEFALISLGESHPVRRHLEQVQDISKRAAELTSRLLSFGRRKAEKLLPVNLNDAINETVNLIQRTIDPKISLITQKHPDLWITFADSGQIHQVLMNLLVNARDALPSGGTITIKSSNEIITTNYCLSHKLARPGEYIRLDICDDGIGISPEDLPRIFEPFFTTKEAGKGTGLGLAMVMDIIVNHKGWIEVESEPNKGTTFSVFLPRLQDTIREEKTSPEAQFQGGSETILLVDDEESVRALGKKTLERFGYTVLLASDGKEAIEIYQKKQSEIDLIIIDLLMPRISGKDTLLELQSLNKEVKVILCSGYAVGETVQEFLNMGAKGFVHKPFAFKQLLGAIREALD